MTSIQKHALFCQVYNRSVYIISVKPRGDSVPSWQRITHKKNWDVVSASRVQCRLLLEISCEFIIKLSILITHRRSPSTLLQEIFEKKCCNLIAIFWSIMNPLVSLTLMFTKGSSHFIIIFGRSFILVHPRPPATIFMTYWRALRAKRSRKLLPVQRYIKIISF